MTSGAFMSASPLSLALVKWIGGGLYAAVTLACGALLTRGVHRSHRIGRQGAFFFLCGIQSAIRAALMFVPKETFTAILAWPAPWGNVAMVFLDLCPEAMFFSTFSLLAATWLDLFVRSRSVASRGEFTRAAVVSIAAIWLAVVILVTLTGILRATYSVAFVWEARYNAVVAGLLLLAVTTSGIALWRVLRSSPITSPLLTRVTSQVFWTTVVVSVSLAVRAVYISILNDAVASWRRAGVISEDVFALIFFFYFFLTEIIPVSAVTAVTVRAISRSERERLSGQGAPAEGDVPSRLGRGSLDPTGTTSLTVNAMRARAGI